MVFIETVATNDCYEYDLTLSDGVFKLNCHTYEAVFSSGDKFDDETWEIYANDIENIYKSTFHEFHIGHHELSQKLHFNAEMLDTNGALFE